MADPDDSGEFRLDRTKFSVVNLTDPDDSLEYWLSRPVEERLRALEFLRRTFYGASACELGIQRVLEVVEFERVEYLPSADPRSASTGRTKDLENLPE